MILLLETSTAVCSAALAQDIHIIDSRQTSLPKAHASQLAVFVDDLLQSNHLTAAELQAVAVSRGPGSYTGLRVGVSTAKGICFGAGIPLLSVCSLQLIAQHFLQHMVQEAQNTNSLPLHIVPMIDARRMEVYTACFSIVKDPLVGLYAQSNSPVESKVVESQSFADLLEKGKVVFIGDGAPKCQSVLTHPNAVFVNCLSNAEGMAAEAFKSFSQKEFEDTAYFTPFYLKEFVAAPPKKEF